MCVVVLMNRSGWWTASTCWRVVTMVERTSWWMVVTRGTLERRWSC